VENLLALSLAALIVMDGAWFQRVLERRVIAGLENVTGGRVEIGHFRFKPWLFQITLQKLVIHGSEAAGEAPLISVYEVDAGLSPAQLFHQRLRLRHLDIDQLQVRLHTDSQGITNLPHRKDQAAQPGLADLMDLSIGRLTISHSLFFWNNQQQSMELEARELAVLLRMTKGHYNGTISSSATTIRSSHWSSPPINFNSRFELSATSLVFSSFAWKTQGTSGEAAFTVIPQPAVQASGSFHGSADIPSLARFIGAPELRAGTLQIEGTAVYQDGAISARGRAQARQVAILTSAFPPLSVEAATSYAWENRRLSLTNLVASVWGGTVQGTLEADFQVSPAKFHLNSRLHQMRLDNFLRPVRTPSVLLAQLHPASTADGTLNATWSGRGEGLKADFDLAMQAPPKTSSSMLPVSGAARGTLEDGRSLTLHLAAAEFHTPHSHITAQGTLAEKIGPQSAAEPLNLTVSTDNFEEWRPFFEALVAAPSGIPLELKSRAEFSGQLSGSYNAPALQGHVSMGEIRYHGWAWDKLTAAVTLNPEFIQITSGRIEHAGSSFDLNASAQLDHWQLTPKSLVRVSAEAQRTPIEGLKAALNFDLPLRGSVSGHVDVQGNAATLAGSGFLRIDAGAFADEPFDIFSTRLQIAKSVWKLQAIRLTKNHGRLSGNLTLEPEKRFVSGQLEGTDFGLADIHRLSMTTSGTLPKGGLNGKLTFEVHGQGTQEDFHLQSTWRLGSLTVAGTPLGEFHGTLKGEGNQLKIEGEDQSPGGNLHVIATATANGEWPMEAQGEYSSLRGDPWIRAFFNHEFAAKVTLGGSFLATGPLRTPDKIDFQSSARDVAIDFPTVQWRNVQPVDVHYSHGRMALSRFIMRGPFTELEIEGVVGVTAGVTMDLSATGTASAGVLTVFDANLQTTGRSDLHLRLTGTPARPLLNGTVDIQDVSLGYNELPLRFNSLQGTINLEGERAVIRSLHGTCGGGTADLSGFITLAEDPHFEVRANLNQVRIRYPTPFTSVLDGRLRLAGSLEQSQLQGELVVRQMAVNENVNFISKMMESANPILEQPTTLTSPIASKIRLNVRVTSSPPVQIQTPNVRLSGDIDIRLQGTVANPVQVGSIHFLSGESVFRGNRYKLVRGDMNMTNPFRTQVYLEMEVETQVQSYNLTLDISGPMDRLKFSYRSDPPLPTTDILSLLALGYVKQEEAFSPVGGSPTTSIGASAILSQALSSQMTGRIQHLFGVSRIKIDPNVGVPGFGSGARVTVEQQVTHDLTLTYVTDTSYSQYRIIQFEWNISDNISVLGVRDQNGIFGMEFRFRRRFK
jgi:translocation and assembly module TamB